MPVEVKPPISELKGRFWGVFRSQVVCLRSQTVFLGLFAKRSGVLAK